MIRFSFHAEIKGEKQVRHCIAVFVNDKTYAVNFTKVESLSGEMAKTREIVFSSMKFHPGLGLNNQLSTKAQMTELTTRDYSLEKLPLGC